MTTHRLQDVRHLVVSDERSRAPYLFSFFISSLSICLTCLTNLGSSSRSAATRSSAFAAAKYLTRYSYSSRNFFSSNPTPERLATCEAVLATVDTSCGAAFPCPVHQLVASVFAWLSNCSTVALSRS